MQRRSRRQKEAIDVPATKASPPMASPPLHRKRRADTEEAEDAEESTPPPTSPPRRPIHASPLKRKKQDHAPAVAEKPKERRKKTSTKASVSSRVAPEDKLRKSIRDVFTAVQTASAPAENARKMRQAIKRYAAEVQEPTFPLSVVQQVANVMLPCLYKMIAAPATTEKTAIERICRLLDRFFGISQKEDLAQHGSAEEEEWTSPTDHLLAILMRALFKGTEAKERAVRIRVMRLLSISMEHLRTVEEEDFFKVMQAKVLPRLRDKELLVRALAIHAAHKLQYDENAEPEQASQDTGNPITAAFHTMLQIDQDPEIRKHVLKHLRYTEDTMSVPLERLRDSNPKIRRWMFDDEKGVRSLIHWELSALAVREFALKSGLEDTEKTVREACSKWISQKLLKDANDNVLLFLLGRQEGDRFLGGMDVIAHPQLVEKTLATIWAQRPDVRPASEGILDQLIPETAILMRTYVAHMVKKGEGEELGPLLPEASAMRDLLEKECLKYRRLLFRHHGLRDPLGGPQEEENDDEEQRAVACTGQHFILSEVLRLSLFVDIEDEMNRRTMEASLLATLRFFFRLPSFILHRLVASAVAKADVSEKDGHDASLATLFQLTLASLERCALSSADFAIAALQTAFSPEKEEASRAEGEINEKLLNDEVTLDKKTAGVVYLTVLLCATVLTHLPRLQPSIDAVLDPLWASTVQPWLASNTMNAFIATLQDNATTSRMEEEANATLVGCKQYAIRCFASLCSLKRSVWTAHWPLFVRRVMKEKATKEKSWLLKTFFDALVLFGAPQPTAEGDEEEEEEKAEALSNLFRSTLDGKRSIRTITVHGLLKCFLQEDFATTEWIGRVLHAFFTTKEPSSELGSIARSGMMLWVITPVEDGNRHQQLLSEVAGEIMLLFCDPEQLKGSFWDAGKVGDILLYMTNPDTFLRTPGNEKCKAIDYDGQLKMVNHLLSLANGEDQVPTATQRAICQVLNKMSFRVDMTRAQLMEWIDQTVDFEQMVEDRVALTALTKAMEKAKSVLKKMDEREARRLAKEETRVVSSETVSPASHSSPPKEQEEVSEEEE